MLLLGSDGKCDKWWLQKTGSRTRSRGSASFGIGLQPSEGRVGVSVVLLSFSSLSQDDRHSFGAHA